MNKDISFGGLTISDNQPPLIIPEIGINHSGDIKIAKKMVDAAHDAGAKCVKHQTHIVDDEMSGSAKKVIPGNSDESIYNIMSRCSLNKDDEYELMKYTESKGMVFISTPFSRAAADRLEEFGIKAFKIGSGECNNYPLIEHIAKFGKPMIVSTGMNELKQIKKTVAILDHYNIQFALMHTTNIYPTPFHLVRLGAIKEMKREFPNIHIGLSDHTINNNACLAATALGANLLERHFTDTMDREGEDICCSMDKHSLRQLIKDTSEVFEMRGGQKESVKEEQVTKDFAFATVVTIESIKKGQEFTYDNIWVKRPGIGEFKADSFDKILGKTALVDIDADVHLTHEMIGD